MSQTRLYVMTDETTAERLLDLLEITFEDDGYAVSTSEIDEQNEIWDASIYVNHSDAEKAQGQFSEILHRHNLNLEVEKEVLPDIDWVAKSLEGLAPVQVNRFLIHGSHDKALVKPHHLAIEINAAQAFGTGHHGTTAGCLEMIEMIGNQSHANLRGFTPILDLGTGSGVLAIAAAKLSHARILATDIDPIATKTARENAIMNEVGDFINFRTINGMSSPEFAKEGPFGLIIANILAKPLMKLAPEIVKNLKPGGTVILSGILAEQRWKVLSAFNREGLGHQHTIWRDGWVTIVLK